MEQKTGVRLPTGRFRRKTPKFRDTGGEVQELLEIEGFCRPRAGCKSQSRN
jgi:hypothetical protein